MHQERGVIGRDIDPDGPVPTEPRRVPGWEQRARTRNEQTSELMALFGQMTAHLGGLLTLAQAPPLNDVLGQMSQFIPASGALQRDWKQNFQSVTVTNFGTSQVTVTAQGLQAEAPSVGSGVAVVPAGVERTMQLRGNAITVYGVVGSLVELVAYARPRAPQSSPCIGTTSTPSLVAVTQPAAGAEFSANPSPGAPFTLAGVSYTLTTDAVVANRIAGVKVAGMPTFNALVQTATQVEAYSFFPGAPVANGVGPLPAGPFPAGTLVASDVTALDVGDQISAISLLIAVEPAAVT